MPTGDVSPTEENLRGWFSAGATCVGMGSKLLSKELIAEKQYNVISTRCADTLELIRSVRMG